MTNIQVTYDINPNNARSESYIAINPNDSLQIVAGSKKFNNIQTYDFTIATAYSNDGGQTWQDSADVPIPGWDGISDPALTWDDSGNVYLVALAFTNPPTMNIVGIAVYKSTNGGQTWSLPNLIHSSPGDDKQWAAGDANMTTSQFSGRVYAVWDDGSNMRFARTLDYGATWIGTGSSPVGSILVNDSFSPEINVATDGTIYIVWAVRDQIKMIVSTDGGDSFNHVTPPATGIKTLSSSLPAKYGFPQLPNGNFRVLTLPTACAGPNTEVVVAWADYRENKSRIYYAFSANGGNSWNTGVSGQPLLTISSPGNQQHFHPQIVFSSGIYGCAFYEFGPKPNTYLIDVNIVFSFDHCTSFTEYRTVTDQPWDPTVNAPWSRGSQNVTFIGEYFGLDARRVLLGNPFSLDARYGVLFYPLWTDTRTGMQELWTDIVLVDPTSNRPDRFQHIAQILVGIINDGGGIEIVGGHFRRVPPRTPSLDILLSIASHRIATLIDDPQGLVLQKTAMDTVVKLAQKEVQRLQKEIPQQLERQNRKSEM